MEKYYGQNSGAGFDGNARNYNEKTSTKKGEVKIQYSKNPEKKVNRNIGEDVEFEDIN